VLFVLVEEAGFDTWLDAPDACEERRGGAEAAWPWALACGACV
jgi:hypothetical protein